MPSDCVSLNCQLWQYSGLPGWLLKQLVWEVHLQVWILLLFYSRNFPCFPMSSKLLETRGIQVLTQLFFWEIYSIPCWEPIHQFRTCVDSVRFWLKWTQIILLFNHFNSSSGFFFSKFCKLTKVYQDHIVTRTFFNYVNNIGYRTHRAYRFAKS